MARGETNDVRANEAQEFALFAEAIGAVEHDYEFVVIDTPASDSYLMRLAHSLADTLVSPLNDSFIDVDVFSRVHHDRSQRGAVAHYADLVMEARRKRRIVDNGVIDWVMVRNRMASIASNNARQIALSVARLASELRFRVADGLHDRVIFRELFPIGLTALDPIEEARSRRSTARRPRRGARSKACSRRSTCPAEPRASSICRRAGSGTTASPNTTASSAPPTGAPAEPPSLAPFTAAAKPLSLTPRSGDRADEDGRGLHARPNAGDFGRHSDQEPPFHARRGDRLGRCARISTTTKSSSSTTASARPSSSPSGSPPSAPSVAPTTLRPARCRARNLGVSLARGEIVAFLDDDDRWGSKSYLSAVRAAIDGRQAATLASGDIVVVDDDMSVLETIPFAASTSPEAIRCDNKILVSGFAFSRALSGRLGPFDETLPIYWDWDWYLRLHAAGVAFHDLGPQAVAIAAHRRATSGDGHSRLRADNLAALSAKHGLGPLTLRNHESIARDEAAGR